MRDRILAAMGDCEPYTAGDLADMLDEPRRTVDYYLRQLAESNCVDNKTHSTQTVTWWRTE